MLQPTSSRPGPIAPLLPRLDSASAASARLLHDARFLRLWQAPDRHVAIVALAKAPIGPLQRLGLSCDAGDIEVLLAAGRHPGVAMTAMAPGGLPAALQRLAAEALWGPVLDRLARLGLGPVRIESFEAFDHETGETGAIPANGWNAIRINDAEPIAFAVRQWPAQAVSQLQHSLMQLRSPGGLRDLVVLRGAVTLAERPLPASLIRSLRPGDVALLDETDAQAGMRCVLRFGLPGRHGLQVPVHVDDQTLTLQGELQMIHDEHTSGDIAEAAADWMATLDIPVRFEIETVALPLAELEALTPGSVVELAMPLSAARVRLVAAGQTVGQAELVAVGDRLGARILRMVNSDANQSRG